MTLTGFRETHLSLLLESIMFYDFRNFPAVLPRQLRRRAMPAVALTAPLLLPDRFLFIFIFISSWRYALFLFPVLCSWRQVVNAVTLCHTRVHIVWCINKCTHVMFKQSFQICLQSETTVLISLVAAYTIIISLYTPFLPFLYEQPLSSQIMYVYSRTKYQPNISKFHFL